MIVVQSPLRISFFGGGTDFPEFYMQEGGCVLSTTIDKYIFITVKKRFDDKVRVGYTKTEMVDCVDDIKHDLIRESLLNTGIQQSVEITTMGDIPSAGSGLGSSSTVTVGALQALYTLKSEVVLPERLAKEACQIEIETLGKPIGIQDQYIAAFGGFRFIEFMQDGRVILDRVSLDPEVEQKLNENLLLYYTGITRKSESILLEQRTKINDRLSVLREMKHLAEYGRDELERGNLDEFGHMLHYAWTLKKKLAGGITTPRVDSLYTAAKKAGALGGKITGAGGGGFFLLYSPREKQKAVREVLMNFKALPFEFEADGAKVIFNYPRSSKSPSYPYISEKITSRRNS